MRVKGKSKPEYSSPIALEIFEAKERELRKQFFAKRKLGDLSFAWGNWLVLREPEPLKPGDQSPLAKVIREVFPRSSAVYWASIARGYRDLFKELPEKDAVVAVSQGFANPGDAMRAGVIPKRRFVGVAEVWP